MKEIKQQLADPVKIEKQAQQEKQLKFLGRIMPHRGHTIWEYNPATQELKPATLETPVVDFNQAAAGRGGSRQKLNIKPGCQYIAALNKKNALKKVKKWHTS